MKPARWSLTLCIALLAGAAGAQKPADRWTAETFAGLELRNIGPAVMSGRIADVAIDPRDRATWYVAAASGGVWKTVNAGTTWTPIFDDQDSYSIGCVTIDPANSKVIWVGTGENNSQRSAGYGDGVYKSLDGGGSWQRMGLETSEHIGKIVIDPRDSDVVWVASQGPLWAPGGERGLYKTSDGGTSWKRVLHVSENTGVSDLVLDPRDPDVVYAASYQRRRRVWTVIAGGPESRLYKSTDGGATWRKLEKGLPDGDVGRIGLAISPHDPDLLYATIAAADQAGGFFRSDDRGESWARVSDLVPIDPQYYMEIFPDPHRAGHLYQTDVFLRRSDDGGASWSSLRSPVKHVDNHSVAFVAEDPDYLLVGCDGGLYESFDHGKSWKYVSNLPITQFYRVGVDNDRPFYNVYGGTQDNDSVGAPSRTNTVHGIRNSDWLNTVGGDGYQTRVDPDDPNLLYSMWQYGHLVRYDKASGELVDIQPQPEAGEPPLKWHWDSPFILSPHSGQRLYFASNRLFRSDDRGDSWRPVSGDLTRGIDRNQLEVMGRVWSPDAVWKNVFTSFYGQATALAESPLAEGLLYVGTDDGLIHVSEDGGGSWRKIERFAGVPERTYVADLAASPHDSNTVYAVFNNHKSGDFTPYLLASRDRGRTWRSIAGDLPERHVTWSILEDPERAGLLFAGTEFGLFFSPNGGERWVELTGGVPTVAFRDLEIQARESDLVAGSFGRGILILDDFSPLRHVDEGLLGEPGHLFPVKDAWMYVQAQPLGWGEKAQQGDAFFTAPNPPFGAVFTYYLRDEARSRRAARRKAEREKGEKGESVPYPSWEALRSEDREHEPTAVLEVRDEEGRVIRRLRGPVTAGFHRVAWDLRHPSPEPLDSAREEGTDEEYQEPTGHPVLPGRYSARLLLRIDGEERALGEPRSFEAVPLGLASLPAADREALQAFQGRAARLQRAVLGALRVAEETERQLDQLERAIDATGGATDGHRARLAAFRLRLAELRTELTGDETVRRRQEPVAPSIVERLALAVDAHWTSTSAATATHRRNYRIAAEAFAPVLEGLRELVEVDLAALHGELEALGAPWTAGRGVPRWRLEEE